MYSFRTKGVCAQQINFDVEDGKVKNVQFIGGCLGNTTGVAKLVEGMKVEEVIEKLKGIKCRRANCSRNAGNITCSVIVILIKIRICIGHYDIRRCY